MQKFYCYVDEAGQHTRGELFVVAVVFVDAEPERERIATLLYEIEETSGKRRQKWNGAKHPERYRYLQAVLNHADFAGKMYFARHYNTREYVELTTTGVAEAIKLYTSSEYKATILVDGLRSGEERKLAATLHKQGVRTEKIRGADDKKDPFIRLADALSGSMIDALEGVASYRTLLESAIKREKLLEI